MTQTATPKLPWRVAFGSCALQFVMVDEIRKMQKSDDPLSHLETLGKIADEWDAFVKENYITP
ncbi:MAG TPA: hypothetical protein V6D19_06570 [Stenomitos sp.]